MDAWTSEHVEAIRASLRREDRRQWRRALDLRCGAEGGRCGRRLGLTVYDTPRAGLVLAGIGAPNNRVREDVLDLLDARNPHRREVWFVTCPRGHRHVLEGPLLVARAREQRGRRGMDPLEVWVGEWPDSAPPGSAD